MVLKSKSYFRKNRKNIKKHKVNENKNLKRPYFQKNKPNKNKLYCKNEHKNYLLNCLLNLCSTIQYEICCFQPNESSKKHD